MEQLIGQFNILEAGDGAEGEEVAIHKSPDLIISDMMMPKVDGLEMCVRIKTIFRPHISRLSCSRHVFQTKLG